MDFENSDSLSCTSPELQDIAINVVDKLIPNKSRTKYEREYENFCDWCGQHNVNVTKLSENNMLAYFEAMSQTKKSSTMWTNYSMLRTCISLYEDIDISKYLKLLAFLKRKSENYHPKKSKILEFEDVVKFINNADDNTLLVMKVILIMGYCGACRRDELTNMSVKDVEFKTDTIMVTVPAIKSNVSRLFVINEPSWIDIIKNYFKLRPINIAHRRFFVRYRNGICVKSPIGINKMAEVPKNIAKFLKLPNPEQYTGHCFRRSSVSQLTNQGSELFTIKKRRDAKSSALAEGNVDVSLKKKKKVVQIISNQTQASTSTKENCSNEQIFEICSCSASENKIESEKTQSRTVIQNKNVVLTKQSFPEISILANNETVTVKIYSHSSIFKTTSDVKC